MYRAVIYAVVSFAAICAPIMAAIEFKEIQSYSFSNVGQIQQVRINDIDADGIPDILMIVRDSVLLYHSQPDSILYISKVDTSEIVSDRKIIFDDINRDSIPDILIGTYYDRSEWLLTSDTCRLDFIDGQSLMKDSVCIIQRIFLNHRFMYGMLGTRPISLFAAQDLNQDGYNEFIFSYDSSIERSEWAPFLVTEISGPTYCYYSFPDSLSWNKGLLLSDPIELGDTEFLATVYTGIYSELGEDYSSTDAQLRLIDMATGALPDRCGPESPSVSKALHEETGHWLVGLCAGEIDAAIPGIELVARYTYAYFSGPPEYKDSVYHEIRMYGLVPPDSLALKWKSAADTLPRDLIYLDDYPGYFFAFVGERFVQFRGFDGAEYQSTSGIPSGSRSWCLLYGDNKLYLSVTSGSTVTIFEPVISTDVGGGEDMPLPASLSFGQPYPNPFNATQTIPIRSRPGRQLTIDIFNILGQKVDCIYDGTITSGQMNLAWQAGALSSGVYFIRATSDGRHSFTRSILLK